MVEILSPLGKFSLECEKVRFSISSRDWIRDVWRFSPSQDVSLEETDKTLRKFMLSSLYAASTYSANMIRPVRVIKKIIEAKKVRALFRITD